MRTTLCLCLVVAVALVGCDDEEPAGPLMPDAGPMMTPADAGAPVTYYEDVRPILAENCVTCHSEGSIAPFTLLTYDEVFEVGERVAEVTRDRVMPPFVVDNSGECNTYRDARTLTQEEIDTIGRWVEQGMPEGDPSTPEPPAAELPTLDETTSSLDMGLDYSPDDSTNDDYRCFVVDPDWTGTQYLTGYDVRPGNAEVVHHIIVYAPIDAGVGEEARRREASEERPGYTCYGDSGVLAIPVVLWAPGAGAVTFPEGTGIALDGSIPLIVQVHYNLLEDDGNPDRSLVDLQLADSVENVAQMALLADFGHSVPPRMESVTNSFRGATVFGPSSNFRVWGAFPHMHTLGRSLRVTSTADGTCMVDVPRWDFNWQGAFFYETPIDLDSNNFQIDCTYNTMERDSVVTWGEGTEDEMCLSFFYVTRR